MRDSIRALSLVTLAAAGCCRDSDFAISWAARQKFQDVCAENILDARDASANIPPQTNPELAEELRSMGYDIHCNCLEACTLSPAGEPLDVQQEADLLRQKRDELDPCGTIPGTPPRDLDNGLTEHNVSVTGCASFLAERAADRDYDFLAELAADVSKTDCSEEE